MKRRNNNKRRQRRGPYGGRQGLPRGSSQGLMRAITHDVNSSNSGERVSRGAVVQPLKGLSSGTVYVFNQLLDESTIIQSNTGANFYAQSYTLAFLDQLSSFTSIFDQYLIRRISVTFRPMYTATSVISSASGGVLTPLIYVAADYDDDTAWTTLAQAHQYQNLIVSDDKKEFTLSFVPHIALGAYSGSVFTSFNNVGPNWIDCASTGVKHYGWKAAITAQESSSTYLQQWNVTARMEVCFKSVR